MRQIGRIIYSYRKLKGVSQEALAGIVGVSPAAVSKWERNLSVPDVEVLCALADYFDVTVDDLLGRNRESTVKLKFDDQTDADRFCLATELLECCTVAQNQGLIPLEERIKKKEGSSYDFLKFCVDYLMKMGLPITPEDAQMYYLPFLLRYAQGEKDVRTAQMAAEAVVRIFLGENKEVIRELLRSFLGRKYAGAFAAGEHEKRLGMSREEMIRFYSSYQGTIEDTGLLDELEQAENERIQRMLRELSSEELVRAAAGASQKVREKLFCNLADRLIWMCGEGLVSFAESTEQVIAVQRRVLELIGRSVFH